MLADCVLGKAHHSLRSGLAAETPSVCACSTECRSPKAWFGCGVSRLSRPQLTGCAQHRLWSSFRHPAHAVAAAMFLTGGGGQLQNWRNPHLGEGLMSPQCVWWLWEIFAVIFERRIERGREPCESAQCQANTRVSDGWCCKVLRPSADRCLACRTDRAAWKHTHTHKHTRLTSSKRSGHTRCWLGKLSECDTLQKTAALCISSYPGQDPIAVANKALSCDSSQSCMAVTPPPRPPPAFFFFRFCCPACGRCCCCCWGAAGKVLVRWFMTACRPAAHTTQPGRQLQGRGGFSGRRRQNQWGAPPPGHVTHAAAVAVGGVTVCRKHYCQMYSTIRQLECMTIAG